MINTKMKLNEIDTLYSFRKKTKENFLQESKTSNSNSNRLFSPNSYVYKPKQSGIPIPQYDKWNLAASNRNNNNSHCIEGKDCPNLQRIQSLVSQIEKHKRTIEEISNLNDFFIHTLSQKDTMYRTLLLESNIMKTNHSGCRDKLIFTPRNNPNRPKSVFVTSGDKKPNRNRTNDNLKPASANNFNHDNNNTTSQKNQLNEIQPDKHSDIDDNNSHYDNLIRISNKSSKKNIQNSQIAFLSMSSNRLKEYKTNEYAEFIAKVTQSESKFDAMVKIDNEEFSSDLFNSIRNISKDFKQLICLALKVKLFLRSTNDLVSNLLNNNFNDLVLADSCKFLNCDQAQLYLYNPISDMLDMYRSDEQSIAPIPKDSGIIGECFTKGKSIKIDDTSNDLKCKSENKRKNIRNMLCYPLKTNEGKVFGVIETLNKRDINFNKDDDELMEIYSNIVSVIMQHNNRKEAYNKTVIQYERIIMYSIEIQAIDNRTEFNEKTEALLNSIFYSTNSRLLFANSENGQLVHRNKVIAPKSNLGIVYYVMKKKKCFACFKAKNCQFYNALIDIETSESLVTYPLLINHECIGVIQIVMNEQLDDKKELPKEKELRLLNLIDKSIINWYKYNKDIIFL